MSNNNLSTMNAGTLIYAPPACEVFLLEAESVICDSYDAPIQGTEIVDEINGIW